MNFALKENNESILTQSQIEKIGNSIVFLCEKIKPLYKTKVLKLLYLIEEVSVRKNGIPFFGVDFEMWKLGPVVKDVYVEITGQSAILNRFFDKKQESDDSIAIIAKTTFCDDEFSDCDMEVLNFVIDKFKDKTAPELIEITHRENYPWYETAKRTGYLELFEKGLKNSSNIVLDLSMLLDNSPWQKEFYINSLNHIRQSGLIKGNH